ncbi:MAG: hypothetical protein GX579_05565 [Chloroflexi bacterium]|jgi:hypothetical protein|nr:hypothetical protein [Chloroflexota bacterium]
MADFSKPETRSSDDTIAMVLEIVFGLFGILGLGWFYAGNLAVGIAAFVGFYILVMAELAVGIASFGLAACLIVPINLVAVIFSGLKARDYVRNTGARGNILYPIIALFVGLFALCGGTLLFFGSLGALLESLS